MYIYFNPRFYEYAFPSATTSFCLTYYVQTELTLTMLRCGPCTKYLTVKLLLNFEIYTLPFSYSVFSHVVTQTNNTTTS